MIPPAHTCHRSRGRYPGDVGANQRARQRRVVDHVQPELRGETEPAEKRTEERVVPAYVLMVHDDLVDRSQPLGPGQTLIDVVDAASTLQMP